MSWCAMPYRFRSNSGGRFGAAGFMLAAAILASGTAKSETEELDLSVLDAIRQTGFDLQLEVFINGAATGFIASVREEADGSLTMDEQELRNVGISPAQAAKRPDGRIELGRLPKVVSVMDKQRQALEFTASGNALAPRIIKPSGGIEPLDGQDPRNEVRSDFGALLNYSLFANSFSGSNDFWTDGVSGTFDGRAFGSAGVLENSFMFSGGDLRRLDTAWTYSQIDTLRTWRMGDVISSGLSWTRPARLGGIQLQRNFSLRPGLVTLPIPDFSGSAAVPSTVDVFLDNTRRFSNAVPAGPFEIADMPVVTGPGTARIVVRDENGNETVTETAYFVSNRLLRSDFFDYSLELGLPRTGYGSDADAYDKRLMGSASVRYGAANWLTLEGHAEGGDGLANLGAGAVAGFGRWGVGSLAVAASTSGGEEGLQLTGAVEFDLFGARLQARMQRAFGTYNDIASVTLPLTDDIRHVHSGAAARSLDQISLSFPLLNASWLNLNYTRAERFDGDSQSVVGASLSRAIMGGTFTASGFADVESDEYGVLASFSVPLGNDISASTSARSGPDGISGIATISRPAREENGNFGWWVSHEQKDDPRWAASGDVRTRVARLGGTVRQENDGASATARVSGSIVAAGGGVFVAERIDDAFAVVDAGSADVPVLFENRPAGRTGGNGKLLLPDLRSYERNRIAIDPKGLPLDTIVDSTKQNVIPAARSGVVVSFGEKKQGGSALIVFKDENGRVLEMGTLGRIDAASEPFMVGYDGEAFVEGLESRNRLILERPGGAKCLAEFVFKPETGTQTMLPDVRCVSLKE